MNKSHDPVLAWVDNLRILATCSVIMLHVAARVVESYSAIPLSAWWTGNLYDSAMRACVPLFVMLTGALVLPQENALYPFLKKRLARILWPFLFWSVVYIAYDYSLKMQAGSALGPFAFVKWTYGKLQDGAAFHLWYVYMITGLYLFIPIIGRWVRAASNEEIRYFLALWALTLLSSYFVVARYGISLDLHYFGGYLGYLVLGYFLAIRQPYSPATKRLATGAVLLGFFLTAVGTYYLTLKNHRAMETAYGNLTPNVCLMAVGIFYLFRYSTWPVVTGFWKIICQNSYSIYLIHILVLMVLTRTNLIISGLPPLLSIPLLTLVCLVISTVISWGIRKSFLGKYIAG